jgi:tetratricopeptide (TPR) repeat protein
LPPRWTRGEVKNDYGIDLFVEIFENGEATALEFRIQSKGHESFSIGHKQVIQPLNVSTLNYYDQLTLPVLLVAYSSQQKQGCYLWIKSYIREVLDKERPDWRELDGKSSIAIRIPLSNAFDDAVAEDILKHVENEIAKIRVRNGGDIQSTDRQKLSYREFAVSTRLSRPKIANYLHRSRLTNALGVALSQQSVFIRADAGYGKTWLLQDFIYATEPQVSIWYTFTKESTDAIRFVEELASELVRQKNQTGAVTLRFIHDRGKDIRSDEALAVLIGEITSASITPILLVLEDMHNVDDATVHSHIIDLVRLRPKNLQLILTSRLSMPNGQAKLIGQGLLTLLEQSELKFTHDETRDYIKSALELELSPEQVGLLHERTGGWIAAIGLAIEVLKNKPAQSEDLFNSLTGFVGNIYDFFADEVYKGLRSETKWLLKRLGLVHVIKPEIVNTLTRKTNGGQVLKDLARHNTFLVEDQEITGNYQLHPLFAEFLLQRFRDEEGSEEIRRAHLLLANFFFSRQEWYPSAEHATEAEDWPVAVQSLEIIGPIGVSLGYGQTLLTWIDKIPGEQRINSPLLCEVVGLSALQIGNLERAAREFDRANNLYINQQDLVALNRLEYYSAEVGLDRGVISPEEFIKTANKVAIWSYKHNDILLGTQVELRLIEVGQTLTIKYGNLFSQLAERSEKLIGRIESLGSGYEIIKAKVLSSQAHLLFQVVTKLFQQETVRIQIREKMGHPIDIGDKVSQAKAVLEGISEVWRLYDEAEKITRGKSDIQWAMIHTGRLRDMAHHMSQFLFVGMVQDPQSSTIEIELQTKEHLLYILAEIDHCVQIFSKFHLSSALAKSLCDAADVYDILGDVSNRDRLANEALGVATDSGFSELMDRARDLLQNKNTFTSLRENAAAGVSDKGLANLGEEEKAAYVNTILRAFSGRLDPDKIREAVVSDVNDMVACAQKRLEWCRHVEMLQDLRHTKSLDTMYREIPRKWIVCKELMYQSPNPGYSFKELWPMFKGVYCLGCASRNLNG